MNFPSPTPAIAGAKPGTKHEVLNLVVTAPRAFHVKISKSSALGGFVNPVFGSKIRSP
jgi:hypothetical protein